MPQSINNQQSRFSLDLGCEYTQSPIEVINKRHGKEHHRGLDSDTKELSLNETTSGLRIRNTNNNTLSFVQVYGERNSGTSFLSKLLRENMREPLNFLGVKKSDSSPLGTKVFGYKHWFTKPEMFKDPREEKTLFVVIYRNPYTWIRAMMDRPYALSKSISGRSIEELPGLKLVGHVNGKDTPNEFHPDTSEKIDLFDLRRLKINNFESVQRHVRNVVYINIETLLHSPADILQILAQKYDSLFLEELKPELDPPRVLVREFEKPALFSAAETELINTHIDWNAENLIGYKKNNYFLKDPKRLKLLILHGSSAVGKSYTLSMLLKEREGLEGIEMDDCRYWDEYAPNFEEQHLKSICPVLSLDAYQALANIVFKADIKEQRNIEFLILKLQSLIARSLTTNAAPAPVVATCGALPIPSRKDELSIYRWLEQQFPVSFHHILIEVPEELHVSRMKKRGRIELKEKILRNNNRRVQSRNTHDDTVSNYKEVLVILDTLQASNQKQPQLSN